MRLPDDVVAELDPGIRDLVVFLNLHNFNTTESGDGVSKEPDARTFDVTHVVIQVEPGVLCAEADRLRRVLESVGVHLMARDYDDKLPAIEASYDPCDGIALIVLSCTPFGWSPPTPVQVFTELPIGRYVSAWKVGERDAGDEDADQPAAEQMAEFEFTFRSTK